MSIPPNPSGDLSPVKRALKAVEAMQAKLDAAERARREPIAIIGLGCRFPGASDAASFWQLLESATDAIREVPAGRWDRGIDAVRLRESGVAGTVKAANGSAHDAAATHDSASRRFALLLELAQELLGFPRHLSQHVGGFVIARDCLEELVPVENAAMPERTVIQWDKDDLDALGLLKVDVLALGMLSAIRRTIDLVSQWRTARGGAPLTLGTIPPEDPAVYDMI